MKRSQRMKCSQRCRFFEALKIVLNWKSVLKKCSDMESVLKIVLLEQQIWSAENI